MKRSIESALASEQYVDSRVSKIESENTDQGVWVRFKIDLGQRVAFSTQGSVFFTRAELMKLIEEQRSIGLGRDYISVIQNRLKEHYVDQGFRAVIITPYSFEPKGTDSRRIVFDIQEGVRSRITSIFFDGNDLFSKEVLEKIFFKGASDRVQAKIYNEKMIDAAAKSMIEELKRLGYLSAKLVAIKTEENKKRGGLNLYIFMSEGLQTRIRNINFRNNIHLREDQLLAYLGLQLDQPLSLVQLEDGLDRIKQAYRNLGFLNVEIEY